MGNLLYDRRSAAEFASAWQVIELTESIASFKHLSEIVEADLAALDAEKIPADWREREIHGELQFGFTGNIPSVSGSASVDIDAVCQRCVQPFRLTLTIEPKLLLVRAEEDIDEIDEYEVWELEQDLLQPLEIVEELLIMALPFSATHDNVSSCRAFSSDDESVQKTTRPFAALASKMQQIEKDAAS